MPLPRAFNAGLSGQHTCGGEGVSGGGGCGPVVVGSPGGGHGSGGGSGGNSGSEGHTTLAPSSPHTADGLPARPLAPSDSLSIKCGALNLQGGDTTPTAVLQWTPCPVSSWTSSVCLRLTLPLAQCLWISQMLTAQPTEPFSQRVQHHLSQSHTPDPQEASASCSGSATPSSHQWKRSP